MKCGCEFKSICNKVWCWWDKQTGSSLCPEAERLRKVQRRKKEVEGGEIKYEKEM